MVWTIALTGGDRGKRWGLTVILEMWAGELKRKMNLIYSLKVIYIYIIYIFPRVGQNTE